MGIKTDLFKGVGSHAIWEMFRWAWNKYALFGGVPMTVAFVAALWKWLFSLSPIWRGVVILAAFAVFYALIWLALAAWKKSRTKAKRGVNKGLEVKFENSDKMIVRVINHDPVNEVRLRHLRIFGIKEGKEVQLVSSDSPSCGKKMHGSFPCILQRGEGRNFKTLFNLSTLPVYGNTGYFTELELENGRTVRSDIVTLQT